MERTGIAEESRYYFADNEPIWYIGDSLSEKKELEDSLNRETIKIDTLNELLVSAENCSIGEQPHANLVIMERLPLHIKENLSTLISAVDIMPFVKVYEINRDALFEYGQEVPSIYKLKELSFDKTRHKNIKTYTDPTDKQAEILRSLELDLDLSKQREKDLANSIEEISKEKKALELEIKDLKFDIDEKYTYKIDNLEKQVEDLQETLDNLQIETDTERNKTNSLYKQVEEINTEKSKLQWETQSLQEIISKKNADIDNLKNEKKNLEIDLDNSYITQNKLLRTTVDEESVITLNEELEKARVTINLKDEENNRVNIELKTMEFKKRNLEQEIDRLRDSSNDIQSQGRTYTLDSGELHSTPLIYIKVAEDLPFLKLYVSILFEFLKKDRDEKGLLLVLRQDEGLDSLMFKGLSYINNLNEVDKSSDMYRMFPSATMFSGLNDYIEPSYDFVFVVDYIKSSDYYLKSDSKEYYMTSVTHSKKIKEFGLRGKPISFDRETVVPIKYDKEIEAMSIPKNRKDAITSNVATWYKNMEFNKKGG